MAADASALPAPRHGWLRALPKPFVRSPLAIASCAVVAAWIAIALLAPVLVGSPLAQDIAGRLAPPSSAHWFGTDPLGRDILNRVVYGARISIPVGLAAVGLAVVLGTMIGSVAGVTGRAVDETLMRLTDLMLAFPTVILAMIISAALGAGIRNAVIAIMVAWWPTYARFARGLVLSARDREYVEAARALGASPVRVFMRHVLVNISSPIVILGTLDVGRAILTFASLSFLGLGPPPQIAEWGSMIAAGRDYLDQWWIATFPGLAILTLVVALNVVGDSLRDTLDPRLRGE